MVIYNPKDWFKLIFHFHKSDTLRILFPTLISLGIVTAAVCYVENQYFVNKIPSLTIFHQITGFIISLVLVFRINTAYDRWWEGRKQWGALVNHSRSLAIKLNAILPNNDLQTRKIISELISNFPFSLKSHLRNNAGIENINFNSVLLQEEYERTEHKPNFIVNKLTALCLELSHKIPKSSNDYLIYSELLSQLTDIGGACERIKNTPIPYSYSIFIKKIIFIYVITMPIAFGLTIGYWSVPIVMIIFYAFASLELLSEEIEDPFGTDLNDLPIDDLAAKIRTNVKEIFFGHGN